MTYQAPAPPETADELLDRMALIVRRDMLTRGRYTSHHIVDQTRYEEGAICGGVRACAIGSLFVANGDLREWPDLYSSRPRLELRFSVSPGSRTDAIREAGPVLREAYDALNLAASRYMHRRGIKPEHIWTTSSTEGDMELLFESEWTDAAPARLRRRAAARPPATARDNYVLSVRQMLGIIRDARALVAAAGAPAPAGGRA